jgi:hypothetical protein
MSDWKELKKQLKQLGTSVSIQLNTNSMFTELGGFVSQAKLGNLYHECNDVGLYPKYGILAKLVDTEGNNYTRAFAFSKQELQNYITRNRLSYKIISVTEGYIFEGRYWG